VTSALNNFWKSYSSVFKILIVVGLVINFIIGVTSLAIGIYLFSKLLIILGTLALVGSVITVFVMITFKVTELW